MRAKQENIYSYSCYAPPSLTITEFTSLIDKMAQNAKKHNPVVIAWNKSQRKRMSWKGCQSRLGFSRKWLPTDYKRNFKSLIIMLDLIMKSDCIAKGRNNLVTNHIFNKSDHRIITCDITIERKKNGPQTRTNYIGWRVDKFDTELFQVALNTGPSMLTDNAKEALKVESYDSL